VRLFVAIPLADSVQARLRRVVDRLRSAGNLRWSSPESWHVTLQFLGNVSEEQYSCLIERLNAIQTGPVPIRISGLGAFERVGVFYAQVEASPGLAALVNRVTAATAACGFVAESRRYRPHITLARGKGPGRARELRTLSSQAPAWLEPAGFLASEFLLYESHLSPAGSSYEVRHRFRLQGLT